MNKQVKITKNTIIFYIITAIITLILSIFISSLVTNKTKSTPSTNVAIDDIRVNSEAFDSIAEKEEVTSLIKSYITASVLGEKTILINLTTGEFQAELNNKNIQKNTDVKFLSNTLTVIPTSLTEKEGILSVKYVLEYNGNNIQQNQIFHTIKENNRWKISKLTNE